MHKFIFIPLFIIIPLMLSSCGKKINMDVKQLDGKFHYENKDLGFQIGLPAEFEYFQTQRKKGVGLVDLEFFVPTADTTVAQEVKGYGKPFLIRVFEKDAWTKIGNNPENKDFIKFGESDRIYAIKFWNEIPSDWKQNWNEEYKKNLISLIKLY